MMKPDPVDPLIFDLNGDGVKTVTLADGVHFDFDKNGFWNTSSRKGYYYKNKIHYFNKNYAEFRFNIKIEEELEDETIYLFDNEIYDKFYI